ncbi:MAG: hypothetical protein D6714_01050 [Bacteroidetes bacterium]|nr:MAG: hypothetical protein D6714_01050 [Bacteroidota bacterium]
MGYFARGCLTLFYENQLVDSVVFRAPIIVRAGSFCGFLVSKNRPTHTGEEKKTLIPHLPSGTFETKN